MWQFKWKKFLNENKQQTIQEISPQYIDKAQDFLKKTPPEKLSFNKIFGDKFRLVIPFESQDVIPNKLQNFVKIAQKSGYSLDFKKGLISKEIEYEIPKGPKQGQKIKKKSAERIGKFLQKMKTLFATWNGTGETGLAEIKKIMPAFNLQNSGFVDFEEALESYEKEGIATDLSILISRHPIDVVRMSDFDHIKSCHSEGGSYFHCAVQEMQGHGLVAYVVKTDDLSKISLQSDEIFKDKQRKIDGIVPLSRIRLRRVLDRA